MKITIVTVNWWAGDFFKLLVDSAIGKAKDQKNVDIVVADNSGILHKQREVFNGSPVPIQCYVPKSNLGHAGGLDYVIENVAMGDLIVVLDVDAHILLQDWDERILEAWQKMKAKDDKFVMMAAEGGQLKPVRPCAMVFEREYFLNNKLSFKARDCEGAKFDVGVHAYLKALSLGGKVKLLKYAKTQYENALGCEYTLDGDPFVYHNFYGTRWFDSEGKLEHNKIDSLGYTDFVEAKKELFKQISWRK